MKFSSLLLVLLLPVFGFATVAQAAIYKTYDSEGNVIYTDKPTQDSQQVIIPDKTPPSTGQPKGSPAPPNSGAKTMPGVTGGLTPEDLQNLQKQAIDKQKQLQAQQPQQNAAAHYKGVSIVSPANQATIIDQTFVIANVSIVPNLRPGDEIQILLDGQPTGRTSTSGSQRVILKTPGAHTLQARIVDSDGGMIMSSSSVTINVEFTKTGSK